jgi:outer membrane protein assembly factor BamD (BamD/ComL family)
VFKGSQQVWTDQIMISNHFSVQSEIIHLTGSKDPSPTVSVWDLMVPERSRKLYEKGKKALGKGEYSKAQESLHAALSVYPNFPRARNALAVAYGHDANWPIC